VTPTRIALAILCALTVATALAPPSPARADQDRRIRVFKVTAEGTGTYQYDLSLPLGDGLGSETRRDISYAWKLQLPSVAFFANGEGTRISAGAAQGSVTGSATEETTIVGSDGRGGKVTTHGYCEAKDQSQPAALTRITPEPFTGDSSAEGSNITVAPFAPFAFPANCTGAIYGGHLDLGLDVAPGQLEQHFFLPTEATRQGKIIQLVHASPEQRNRCASTLSLGDCKFDWSGTLTFEFTGYLGEGELTPDDLPDLPAGGGAPDQPGTQSPGTQTPDPDEDLLVPLPSGGSLSRRGDSASIKVRCSATCSGTVSAYPARTARAAAAKPLAKARFSAPADKAVTVKLKFRGKQVRRVRKAKAVRLLVDTGTAKKSVLVRSR
jgi:hypothetical protein